MSDQKSRSPETWSLNEWRRHQNPPPFDLKQENFSMVWTSSTEGTIEFRLVSGEAYSIRFALHADAKYKGELPKNGRPFPFEFAITQRPGSRRQMQGAFFSASGTSGPDPVASWGAEERGGNPIGHGEHGRGEHQLEPAMRR